MMSLLPNVIEMQKEQDGRAILRGDILQIIKRGSLTAGNRYTLSIKTVKKE